MSKDLTTWELISKAKEDNELSVSFLNQTIMEISKSRGKKPGYLKFAVSDETAGKFMMGEQSLIGIVLTIDRDYMNKLINAKKEDAS